MAAGLSMTGESVLMDAGGYNANLIRYLKILDIKII